MMAAIFDTGNHGHKSEKTMRPVARTAETKARMRFQ